MSKQIKSIKSMKKLVMFFGILLLFLSCSNKKSNPQKQAENEPKEQISSRYVKDNTLISHELPKIEIKVDSEFKFVGKFDFEIIANSDEYSENMQGKPVAAGERYVFASTDNNRSVNKLFIVQFEGFLPENDLIYNYNFDKANFIGENKYRHNTWFYDSKKQALENPLNEGAKTRAFLEEKGFLLEDQFMMSRYVGLASEDRKNEIIIFYHEMLKKTTGYSLEEYENSLSDEETKSILNLFFERAQKSFNITKG